MDPFRFLLGPDDPRPTGRTRRVHTFPAFIREYTLPARTWLVILGLPQEDAEDIVQSALLALWERRERVPPPAWPMWLLSAIMLRRTELLRNREIRRRHAPRAAWEAKLDAAEGTAGAEEQLGSAETSALVKELVAGLRPELQAIVRAYLFEEQPMAEAAAALGIPLPTAWDRWRRARRELLGRIARRRERERFRAGAVSFGVLLALVERLRALWRRWLVAATAALSGPKPALVAAAALALAAASPSATPPVDTGDRPGVAGALARGASALAAVRGLSGGAGSAQTARVTAAPPLASVPVSAAALASVPVSAGSVGWRPVSATAPGGAGAGAQDRAARREAARALLVHAAHALHDAGAPAHARSLLDQYEQRYPERPYAAYHAALVRDLISR